MLVRVASFLCFLSVTYGLLGANVRGNVPWFQNGLNLLNNNNGNTNNRIRDTFMNGVLRGKNSPCNGTGTMALSEGLCKPNSECRLLGGTPSGSCALVGSCCIQERTCGNTTNVRVSYFTNPTVFQPDCGLTVRLANRNVCQIRLDFDQFTIANPDGQDPNPVAPALCRNDTFRITGASVENIGFDALCGVNTGQHIYIPVNSSMSNAIMINFALRPDRAGIVATPTWRIRVRQLECEGTLQDFSSVQSALTTLYEKHQNKKNGQRNDRNLIAPPGCLQYYPETMGSYSSFNYNNGAGRMIANTNYAICFRRQLNTCGVQHTATNFQLEGPEPPTGPCRATDGTGDWLFVPGVSVTSQADPTTQDPGVTRQDYLCQTDLGDATTGSQTNSVTSATSGPLFVGVRTDGVIGDPDGLGFQINYQTLTSNCEATTVAPPAATP